MSWKMHKSATVREMTAIGNNIDEHARRWKKRFSQNKKWMAK